MISMASQLKAMVDEIQRRNERELFLKERDIHYRDWLFDFVVEKNNDILAKIIGDGATSIKEKADEVVENAIEEVSNALPETQE